MPYLVSATHTIIDDGTQGTYKRVLEKRNPDLKCERVYAAALGPSELVLGTLLSKNLKIEPNTLT